MIPVARTHGSRSRQLPLLRKSHNPVELRLALRDAVRAHVRKETRPGQPCVTGLFQGVHAEGRVPGKGPSHVIDLEVGSRFWLVVRWAEIEIMRVKHALLPP